MYYMWLNTEGWLCPDIVDYTKLEDDADVFVFDTLAGLALEQPLPEITFLVNSFDGLAGRDSLWAGLPYLVVSPRLRHALAEAGAGNVQYYPAVIRNLATDEVIRDFAIANIIGLAFCMDWQHSVFTPEEDLPGYVAEVSRLVLDPAKIPVDLSLFRLGELSSIVLCDHQVREVLTERNIVGVEFVPVVMS
jgi:hypothetical protein